MHLRHLQDELSKVREHGARLEREVAELTRYNTALRAEIEDRATEVAIAADQGGAEHA